MFDQYFIAFYLLEIQASSSNIAVYRSAAVLGSSTTDEFISSLPRKTDSSKPSACVAADLMYR